MSDLRELYQQMILDHSKKPRNFQVPEAATSSAEGLNPVCGDHVTVHVRVGDDGRIEEIGFQGHGCAISTASASMMTEALKGLTPEETQAVFARFHEMVTGEAEPDVAEMGKLAVLAGVKEFPMRVKCATLAWHTLKAALSRDDDTVTTE